MHKVLSFLNPFLLDRQTYFQFSTLKEWDELFGILAFLGFLTILIPSVVMFVGLFANWILFRIILIGIFMIYSANIFLFFTIIFNRISSDDIRW